MRKTEPEQACAIKGQGASRYNRNLRKQEEQSQRRDGRDQKPEPLRPPRSGLVQLLIILTGADSHIHRCLSEYARAPVYICTGACLNMHRTR